MNDRLEPVLADDNYATITVPIKMEVTLEADTAAIAREMVTTAEKRHDVLAAWEE